MSANNEPAFPVIAANGLGHVADGMTLRDWFAGQALPAAAITLSIGNLPKGTDMPRLVAQFAYEVADAMLADRAIEAAK